MCCQSTQVLSLEIAGHIMPRGKQDQNSKQTKKKETSSSLQNDNATVCMPLSELKSLMKSIAAEVFDEKKGPLKSDIEEECEYQVYIQSVEIEQTFEKFQDQLKSRAETTDFKKIVEDQCSKTLSSAMQSSKEEIDALKTENMKMRRRLEKLQFNLSRKEAKIEELKLKIDEIEQSQYQKNVRIVGMPGDEGDGSDVKNIRKMAKTVLEMDVKETDIVETYRLGKVTEKKRNRDLIVKFKKKSTRDKFYSKRKNLVPKPDQINVFINEQLSEHRANIFFAARKLVKSKKLHSAWSQRGNILIRKEEGDRPKQISTHEQLRRIIGEPEIEDEFDDISLDEDLGSSDEED